MIELDAGEFQADATKNRCWHPELARERRHGQKVERVLVQTIAQPPIGELRVRDVRIGAQVTALVEHAEPILYKVRHNLLQLPILTASTSIVGYHREERDQPVRYVVSLVHLSTMQ